MTTWSADDLRRVAETDDLHICPFRGDGVTYGTPTGIWSVVVDDQLYVRAYQRSGVTLVPVGDDLHCRQVSSRCSRSSQGRLGRLLQRCAGSLYLGRINPAPLSGRVVGPGVGVASGSGDRRGRVVAEGA